MENYGGRIKELRERHGLTQKELAEKLGVSAQAVSKWENNVNQPDVSTIRKLCAIFGISVDEFLQESIPQNMATPNVTLTQNAQAIKPNKRKRFWIIFSICAGAILSFTFSFLCVFIPLSALWSNGKLSSQRIYKKVDPSVFFIEIETENGGKQGGSGFFIDKNGTAVTNYHVVQGGTSGRVVLANGREYEVESVLGKDKHSDLVIIKIDIPKSTPVKLADSLSVATGDRVYTIGYPESFALGVESSTFTEGIVSKASYTVEGVEYIQTNADITHGNSGGVLLNEKGEVIGITTGAININGVRYMNLALPSNNIKRIDKTEYMIPLEEFTEKVREYTVHFMNGSTECDVRKVLSGERVEEIEPSVEKTGYTFTGWYTDKSTKNLYDFDKRIKDDLWLYAGWKANCYTLTFDKGGETVTGSVADIAAEYDKEVALPECTFVLPEYRFMGWKYGEKTYQAGEDVTNISTKDGDVLTFTAVWEKVKKYTISFERGRDDAQGALPAPILAEEWTDYVLPTPAFTHQDWRAVRWQVKDTATTYAFGESVRDLTQEDGGEVILVAVWEKIKRYTLFFEAGQSEVQGTLPSPVVIEVGKDYVLPTPEITCKGWNLISWQLKDTATTYAFGANVRDLTQEDGGEVTLVAVWERKTWWIGFDFDSEESVNDSQTLTYGDILRLPSEDECKKTGYTFVGWEWNGERYSAGEQIENFYTDTPWAEFKAVWQGKTYSVKYVVITNAATSEFVIEETQFTYGTGYTWATEINGFEKEGYKIASWHWKEKDIYFTAGALASPLDEKATVELYAKISPITFSVIILGADGQDLRSMSMQYGQDLTFENCLGIATDGKYYAESAKILNADKTEYTGDPRYACAQDGGVVYLQPDWQEQKYKILLQLTWLDVRGEEHTAYMDANGELQEETTWIRLDYSQEFTFPTPTIEGYAFNGWEYYDWLDWNTVLGVYQGGDTICKFTENVGYDPVPPVAKFVAKLTPYTYVVRYDGNGAQLGSMADGSGAYGKAFTFANNAYIKSGCVFGGWLHGETLYSKNEQVYFVPTYDGEVILLKAHWISYTGAGTQAEPYLISTYEDLFNLSIAMQEKASFCSAHYRMTADIDCQNKILYPIDGYTENTFSDGEFTGVFDGGGYVVKNAVFARKANGSQFYKGLFGAVRGATIKNLGVVDYTMEQTVATYTAPLVAGLFDGTVENCYADGNLACPVGGYIGGMIGRMVMGTVKNCKASGTLSVHYDIKSTTVASYYIGGFVGALNSGYLYTAATLERCYTDMDISLTKGEYNQIPRFYLGAFTGDVSGVAFTNCIATGNISMELVNVATDGTTFHGKFNGGLRWANGSLSASYVTFDHCYTSLEAVYNIDFVDDGNVTAKPNTELKSLSWLKENLGYDDTLWTENGGEITLRSFIRGS